MVDFCAQKPKDAGSNPIDSEVSKILRSDCIALHNIFSSVRHNMESRSPNDGIYEIGNIAELLGRKGWAVFDLRLLELTEQERAAVLHWEAVVGSAFNLSKDEKERAGTYRVDQGVSVGYRVDSEREFFESRLTSTSLPEPNFPSVPDYAGTVLCMYSIFSKIARRCMEDVACSVGLDVQAFLDLTDVDCAGILPESAPSKGSAYFGVKELIPTLSSSLLRICKYKSTDHEVEEDAQVVDPEQDALSPSQESTAHHAPGKKNVWFGAHTDSSFLTISLCSSTPGLDIVDQETNSWVCPEKEILEMNLPDRTEAVDTTVFTSLNKTSPPSEPSFPTSSSHFAIVFVGEFLQVLTKTRFRAAVHRVRNFSAEGPPHTPVKDAHRTRISCPFIVRGRNSAVIDLHNLERYAHPGGEEALAEDKVPNLDGTTMQLMHKLLDLKRQKCFRENGSAEGASWVLSAYPVPPLPEED